MKTRGSYVRAARKAKGWTQQDLADALTRHGAPTSRETVSNIERDAVDRLEAGLAAALRDVLGLSASILGLEERRPADPLRRVFRLEGWDVMIGPGYDSLFIQLSCRVAQPDQDAGQLSPGRTYAMTPAQANELAEVLMQAVSAMASGEQKQR